MNHLSIVKAMFEKKIKNSYYTAHTKNTISYFLSTNIGRTGLEIKN